MLKSIIPLLEDIANKKQEYCLCFTLDVNGRLIEKHLVFIGTLDSVHVHAREIFAYAVTDHAKSIIIAHNHPSASVKPSIHDIEMTQMLYTAGRIIGIPLADHIIVSGKKHFSFHEEGKVIDDIANLIEGNQGDRLKG